MDKDNTSNTSNKTDAAPEALPAPQPFRVALRDALCLQDNVTDDQIISVVRGLVTPASNEEIAGLDDKIESLSAEVKAANEASDAVRKANSQLLDAANILSDINAKTSALLHSLLRR
jgi:hypothetical protein